MVSTQNIRRSTPITMLLLTLLVTILLIANTRILFAQELGEMWGTAEEESKYYKLVEVPIPGEIPLRTGSFDIHPDGRLIVGTRKGDVYFVDGAFDELPEPKYHLYASGQDEIFGIAHKDGSVYITQFGEVTKLSDTDNDGVADRFDTLTNNWGYAEGHEFAFGSKPDPEGNIWVALGLTASYHSRQVFRGWAVKVTPKGEMIPVCSGLRSPGGVGPNAEGVMFCVESQGPWNGACSLKHLKQGGFLGHPASYNWYPYAKGMVAPSVAPESNSRIVIEKKRVKELVPPAVIFPYIKMGRSISGFRLNRTKGKFGPFDDQIFVGDYTLSVILRATTEKVNGVWQGACYPFREGLSTGIMHVEFSPQGQLIAGGFTTNAQWPVRGEKKYALDRLDWTGLVPFEMKEIKIKKDGFQIEFTKPVDATVAALAETYGITTYTHIYAGFYGSPEVDHTTPKVSKVEVAEDAMTVRVYLDKIEEGHIHDFDLANMKSKDGGKLLHKKAYYTVNEIPK
ncbi:MAG: hypothetical protein ACI9G1_005523 [Pirellulaceae bacterium]|jgi:hypothetical protein